MTEAILGTKKQQFSSLWILKQMEDIAWLNRITDELYAFSEERNAKPANKDQGETPIE